MYGDKDSHPIYVWNGILEPKHLKRLGPAFSLFIWLIDRTTKEHDGIGAVLGGKPLKAEEIGSSMGVCEKTILRRLDRLDRHCYIERTLTPHGYIITVKKSCKFPNRSSVVGQKCPTTQEPGRTEVSDLTGQECPTTQDRSVRPNKSKQLSKQFEEAAACPVWKETGVDPASLPGPFRKLCLDLWPTRNGDSLFDFMGLVLDTWKALGGKSYPRSWVKRKSDLGREPKREPERPELEAIPWKK
jgi:hypothetical protein